MVSTKAMEMARKVLGSKVDSKILNKVSLQLVQKDEHPAWGW
jgi:hypothetical protein